MGVVTDNITMQCTDMTEAWEINSDRRSAVRVAGIPTTAGRAATKGWVLYCINARAQGQAEANTKQHNEAGENNGQQRHLC